MGKRGGWFSAVKRALYSDSSEEKDQKRNKSKKKWFGKSARGPSNTVLTPGDVETLPVAAPPLPSSLENLKLAQVEDEQSKHAYSVALATAVAAEAAVAAAQAAAEVVRLTSVARYSGKFKEEMAAIKIQTVFRGYMVCSALFSHHRNLEQSILCDRSVDSLWGIEAGKNIIGGLVVEKVSYFQARRALRALRGLVRLKTLIKSQSVKRQAATTLRYMQALSRLQSQVRARRIRMSEENQALQRQLQHKQEKEIEKLRLAGSWNNSTHSKEQMEANLLYKQEAAIRWERALAYAFSHQKTRKNSKSANQLFMDPNNPRWGWSWLERWMASRPWDARTITSKANDRTSLKSEGVTSALSIRELNRSNSSRHDSWKPSSTAPKTTRARSQHYSPSTPTSNDSRSMFSVQSEMVRRHSIEGSSSARDDESLTSTPTIPSYMAPTMSAKAKSRVPSPLRVNTMSDKMYMGSARKRLSFPSSPGGIIGARRLSGPPKVDITSIKGLVM